MHKSIRTARQTVLDPDPVAESLPGIQQTPIHEGVFGKWERHYQIVSLLLVAVALVVALVPGKGRPLADFAMLVEYYVFFSIAHVFFSIFILSHLPEGRAFLKDLFRQTPWPIWVGALLLVVLPFQKWIAATGSIGFFSIGIIMHVLNARHDVGQVFGLSILYNRKASEDRASLERLEKWERLFFRGFIFLMIVQRLFFPPLRMVNREVALWLMLPLMLLIVCILWVAARSPARIRRNKMAFLSRLFIYPLATLSPVINSIRGALHGTEYLLLTTQMTGRSKGSKIATSAYLMVAIALAFTVAHFFLVNSRTALFPSIRPIALSIYVTCLYMHYYVDSFLYRARSPIVRAHIGPLLFAE